MRSAILLLSLLLPTAVLADALPAKPYIQVNGHGEVHVAPDLMRVSLTLEKTDLDLAAARQDVEMRSTKVIEAARKLGVADKDITAAAVYVEPQYDWVKGAQHYLGQRVTRSIGLTLRDVGRYADLVNGLFAAGVTRLDGVVPDRSDREALQQKALQLAVVQAREKAAAMANGASVALGPLYSVSEQGTGYVPRPRFMATAALAAPAPQEQEAEYVSGEIEIDANVIAYYLIGN